MSLKMMGSKARWQAVLPRVGVDGKMDMGRQGNNTGTLRQYAGQNLQGSRLGGIDSRVSFADSRNPAGWGAASRP